MLFEELVRKLKHEPGVIGVYLVGSASKGKVHPEDLDLAVNVFMEPEREGELREKYGEVLVTYGGREIPVDLGIHSTNVSESEWLPLHYKKL